MAAAENPEATTPRARVGLAAVTLAMNISDDTMDIANRMLALCGLRLADIE